MKRVIKFIYAFVLLFIVFPVSAQQAATQQYEYEENYLREVAERNSYGDNWFISFGGMGNLLFGEQDGSTSLWKKRTKFGINLTAGKWFNPSFGTRMQISGGAMRGFNDINSRWPDGYYVHSNNNHNRYPYGLKFVETEEEAVRLKKQVGDPLWDDYGPYKKFMDDYGKTHDMYGLWQDFKYVGFTFDLMGNFTNLFRGYYKENNAIDVIPYLGLGFVHAFDNMTSGQKYYHFLIRFGLRLNFNVTRNISLYLEPQANGTEKEFDGYGGTAFGDLFLNLGLGFQYTFNKRYTSLNEYAQLTADEIDRLNTKININRNLIENHQDILERQQDLLDRLDKCCDDNRREVVSQVVRTGNLPEYIRFTLDSYRIESSEMQKILEVSDYLRRNPSSRLLIIGYADRRTGNPRYNMDLSRKRVDAVAYELRRLGVSDSRINIEWRGDREQPFPQNDWNRVVIMIERK